LQVRYRSGCHSTCGSVVVLTAAYSGLQATSLHFTFTLFRVSCLNHFAPFRFHSVQSLAAHRLPVLGSPAGRCGLRLNCFICLRFALAMKAVALCTRFTPCFSSRKANSKHTVPLRTYAAKGYRILKPSLCTTLAPLAGGSRCLVSVRNPFRYAPFIAATAQPSGSRLFLLCGIFPYPAF